MEKLTPQFGNFVAYNYTPEKVTKTRDGFDRSECGGGILLAFDGNYALVAVEAEQGEPGAKHCRVLFGGEIKTVFSKLVAMPADCVFHAPTFPRKEEPLWGVYKPLLKAHGMPMPAIVADVFQIA